MRSLATSVTPSSSLTFTHTHQHASTHAALRACFVTRHEEAVKPAVPADAQACVDSQSFRWGGQCHLPRPHRVRQRVSDQRSWPVQLGFGGVHGVVVPLLREGRGSMEEAAEGEKLGKVCRHRGEQNSYHKIPFTLLRNDVAGGRTPSSSSSSCHLLQSALHALASVS